MGTAGPYQGATKRVSMGSPQSLVFNSICGGVVQSSLQTGRKAAGNRATW